MLNVPKILLEGELVEADLEARLRARRRGRHLPLVVLRQVPELALELLGGDRLDSEPAANRVGTRVGADHQPPILEPLLDQVLPTEIAGDGHVRGRSHALSVPSVPATVSARDGSAVEA